MHGFEKGRRVWVFFRSSSEPRANRVCFHRAAVDAADPTRPGLSDGWMPARVADDFDPARYDPANPETFVSLCDLGEGLHAPRRAAGRTAVRARPDDVRARSGQGASPEPDGPDPVLGLVVVRWGGAEVASPEEWGASGSSVSDAYISGFVEHGLLGALGLDRRFEIWTVSVERSADLLALADSAPLVFDDAHPLRRCENLRTAFFLWPTAFDVDRMHASADGEAAGYVSRRALLAAMAALERVGIRAAHPHGAGLYDALTGKTWQPVACLDPTLRIPVTLALARGDVEADVSASARQSLAGLEAARRAQHRRGLVPVGMAPGGRASGEPSPAGFEVSRGVVKLGYSWEAQDVKHWRGEAGLENALRALSSAGNTAGASDAEHDCDQLLVQEFVPHDCELRLYFVEGVCELVLGTRMQSITESNDFTELVCCTLGESRYRFFDGDDAAFEDAVTQCRELSRLWLDWILVQNGGRVPPAIRFDFLARRTEHGPVDVRTLEVCEQGFSCLGDETISPKVFAAIARRCVGRGVAFAPHQLDRATDAGLRDATDLRSPGVTCPDLHPAVRTLLTEEGLIAHDVVTEAIHHLNPSASLILTLCDGSRPVAAIKAEVLDVLREAGMQAVPDADLDAWFVQAVETGLIAFDRPVPAEPRELTAAQLRRLAARLRQGGKPDAARECQRRASILEHEATRG